MKIISQRGFVLLALLGLVATLALATAAGAATDLQPLEQAPSAETGQMTDESPKYWFVEFPTAPLADGSSAAAVDSDGAAFRQEASSEGASYKQRMEFKTLWNGVSIEAKSGAIAKIRQFDSVKAVYPVQTHGIPVTTKVSPDLATALAMTGADIAQNELGLTGEGIKVAVMDTGIDYDHPDLGAGFGPGKRVVTAGTSSVTPTTPIRRLPPSTRSRLRIPIRTTATGTARTSPASSAPRAAVTGVAPGVTFGAYRVFGCAGLGDRRHHDRGDGADPRRRHGRAQHEHRRCVQQLARQPDRRGLRPPRQEGHRRRRLDRQQRRQRPLCRRRSRRRRGRDRRCLVREQPRGADHVHGLAGRRVDRLRQRGRRASRPDLGQPPAGPDRHADDRR